MAAPSWTKPEHVDANDHFDSPVPSSSRANRTDGILNFWVFYGNPDNYQEPEQRLMVAVLKDALYCAYDKPPSGKDGGKNKKEALHWIWDLTADGTFSFNSVCQALNLEPEFVRRELNKQCTKKKN